MRRIVIGNWKMHLNLAEAIALTQANLRIAETHHTLTIVIAPSLPWLVPIREAIRWMPPNFKLASQAVSRWPEGAYTGDVSAGQLKNVVSHCLVGHSERRRYHHEKGSVISDQVKLLLAHGITPVVCFGEMSQSAQRVFSPQTTIDLGQDLSGLATDEVQKCLFAYEPLWAIGTGKPAHPDYVQKVIAHVKAWGGETYNTSLNVLYGGSVTEENAQALGVIRELDGLLVGGASLHARQFGKICSLFSAHV